MSFPTHDKNLDERNPIFCTKDDHTFSAVEISVFLIIDLPKYHFLHQTEDNPSFDYYDVLVSDILVEIFSNMKNLNLKLN